MDPYGDNDLFKPRAGRASENRRDRYSRRAGPAEDDEYGGGGLFSGIDDSQPQGPPRRKDLGGGGLFGAGDLGEEDPDGLMKSK